MTAEQAPLERRIERLRLEGGRGIFAENRVGLEKEGLRVGASGKLARTSHPRELGAALTHPYITTDFSEALIELITPALTDSAEALDFLEDIHRFVYLHLGEELLWATSMPCVLEGARSIPLARYGTSNAGIMKTVYRRGLGNRYGRTMQVIAGVHFNFSFGEDFWRLYQRQEADGADPVTFRSAAQMGMIRNLQRRGWLIPYLFGASPAVCASFVQDQSTDLEPFDSSTLYYPYATSLRMGDIGYQNKQEEGTGMKACYDSLDSYVRSLDWAIQTPCPQYESIGVKIGDRYEQLNANVLQIENEYYSTVRPKQLTRWMEKPTQALKRRGILYVELRSLDVNPFEPLGIGLDQMLFIETLMLYCLLSESPHVAATERDHIDENLVLTAHRGREPGLTLMWDRRPVALKVWASELLDRMVAVAELLDGGADGPRSQTLRRQMDKVTHPDLTPSARLLETMRERREGFFAVSRRLSEEHRAYFLADPPSDARSVLFEELALESIRRQAEIEAADDRSFDDFLRDYFAQDEEGAETRPAWARPDP
ncbi:glutamate--cysteine ligase [Imhoffiella purpurea]|uniref:Glutamate--cysteine ligase n=1 Tax=Imhoffiella purpurea TaxID=1249627 RepID=W9VDY1_9GAMM|nr:glutamate--cysteine ligase [Imhoffiella purpurea]EXJ15201.1 Glutamate--cysteine ligase [Imhoffiella purpurea]